MTISYWDRRMWMVVCGFGVGDGVDGVGDAGMVWEIGVSRVGGVMGDDGNGVVGLKELINSVLD
jgi:hypothetical protein